MVVLIWKPVYMNQNNPNAPRNACLLNGASLSVLVHPPMTTDYRDQNFKGILGDFFGEIIEKCFVGQCQMSPESFKITVFNSTASFVVSMKENNSDIAFPIMRPLKMFLTSDDYNGSRFRFEEFMKTPWYSLILDVKNFNSKANSIVFKTLGESVWPIVIFTLLIAGISGICVWALETYFNEEEFPRSFTKGTYEGFWWAFVSMTTVGYGDKTPKFVLGRMFGVLWILLGLVVIAMFTATATSAFSIDVDSLARVTGQRIGVMSNTTARLEANKLGAKEVKEFASKQALLSALRKNEIEGIFMDKYMASYMLYKQNDSNFKVFKDYEEKIPYELAYRDSPLLRDAFERETCARNLLQKSFVDSYLMKYLKPVVAYNADSDAISPFSGENPCTRKFLLIIMGVFLGLLCIGLVAEVVVRIIKRRNKKVKNVAGEIDLKEVKVHNSKEHLKDIEDKVSQLVNEVGKLQTQLAAMSSSVNGTQFGGQHTPHF